MQLNPVDAKEAKREVTTQSVRECDEPRRWWRHTKEGIDTERTPAVHTGRDHRSAQKGKNGEHSAPKALYKASTWGECRCD